MSRTIREVVRRRLWAPFVRGLSTVREKQRPSSRDLHALQRLADRLAPGLRKRFLDAVRQSRAAIDLERLAAAIEANSLSRAEAAAALAEWPERFGGLAADLRAGFHIGAQLAIRDLARSRIDLRFDLVNQHAIDHAERQVIKIVKPFTDDAKEVIRQQVTLGVRGGQTPDEIARAIKDRIGLNPQRVQALETFTQKLIERGVEGEALARRIARREEALLRDRAETIALTEGHRAAAAGHLETYQEAVRQGLLEKDSTVKVWLLTWDEALCDACEAMDGVAVPLDEPFAVDVDGRPVVNVFGEPMDEPDMHPRCFLPGTQVAGRFRVGLKTVYAGPAVELVTRQGYRLAITANHPVATRHGWVAASQLKKGQYVLSQRRITSSVSMFRQVENQDMPTVVEEVFEALRPRGFTAAQIGGLDLHGDARYTDRQIEIVGTDGELWRDTETDSRQGLSKVPFVLADMEKTIGDGFCMLEFRGPRDDSATARLPRRSQLAFDQRAVLLDPLPLQALSFGPPPHWYAEFTKPSCEHGACHAAFLAQLLQRTASLITEDELVEVRNFETCSHVYDFETTTGWILAQHIITSNCRCTFAVMPREDVADWNERVEERRPDEKPESRR